MRKFFFYHSSFLFPSSISTRFFRNIPNTFPWRAGLLCGGYKISNFFPSTRSPAHFQAFSLSAIILLSQNVLSAAQNTHHRFSAFSPKMKRRRSVKIFSWLEKFNKHFSTFFQPKSRLKSLTLPEFESCHIWSSTYVIFKSERTIDIH